MMNCGLGARVSNDASDGAVDGMYVEYDAALPLELCCRPDGPGAWKFDTDDSSSRLRRIARPRPR